MATTNIWKISSRLDRVIKYTTDEDKTTEISNDTFKELHNVIEYSEDDSKTEEKLYVSGINCCPETAYDEMIITKKAWNKTGGNLGYHAFQSFAEGEVSPLLAHEIGIKLAEEMWGDRFEVVVSTHLNTKHYHNHFVINSVSFKDGKKYYDNRETYAELRYLSDELCKEYGLNVLEEKKTRSGINYNNYYYKGIETSNYYTTTKEDLNYAIKNAYSYKDFERLMKEMKYDLIYRYNRLSVRKEGYKKNIRIERAFGDYYSIANINNRIIKNQNYRNRLSTKIVDKKKIKGLRGLFIHYCYLLKVFPKKYPNNYLSPEIKRDIKIMNNLSKETRLLVSNKIETYEQFFSYKNNKVKDLSILLGERRKMWYQHKKVNDDISKLKIESKINDLSKRIKVIQEEVKLLNDIEKRTPDIDEKIKNYEKKEIERRESVIDELIR